MVVATSDSSVEWSAGSTSPVVPPPYRSVVIFVAAIRAGDAAALRALFLFYAPLLRDQARKMSVPEDERSELVTTLLDDFVLRLYDTDHVPRELARYLVTALRNRARNRHRNDTRHRATSERAYASVGSGGERIVAECHSEYGLRSARPPSDDESASVSAALATLATTSALALRDDEVALMVGLSRHVPLRELAAQAGITYGNARVRVHRLRERFRKLAVAHVDTLGGDDRKEMERFFRRAGICLTSTNAREGSNDAD